MRKKEKNIKILEIITLFSIGGATETVISMSSGLKEMGHHVDIASGPNIPSEGSMYKTAEKLGIKVFTFSNLKREINLFRDVQIIFKLKKFIKIGNYNVVHTHSSKAGVVGRIAARLAGVPVVVHTIHGLPFHRYQPILKKWFFIFVERFAALFCDQLVAVTYTIIEEFVKYKIASPEKLTMIRSSFDLDIYDNCNISNAGIRKKFGLEISDFVIGKIARLSELKGHTYLIQAIKLAKEKFPRLKLLIIGDGELQSKLENQVKEAELEENVIFAGLIFPDDIPAVINSMDVLVHTSLLEGLARVLPQAIMMQKPIISFNLDGAHEVIKDGINGYLIEPENINQLAEKILLLSQDRNKAVEMGKVGKEFLGDEFSEKKMTAQINDLYLRLNSEKNK